MRVGLLTTWNTQCGIAQYSRHLGNALARAGADVTVLGSRNYGARETGEESELPVERVFGVEMWNGGQDSELDASRILAMGFDVIHCQYEVALYNRPRLQELLDQHEGASAITWHDKCVPADMPGPWDLQFRHREDTGPAGHVIPFGIEDVPPLVRTFGLGRTQEDVIRPICERNGWRFESAATSEAAFGGQAWLSQLELHEWLREADAIVLWYPDAEMAGSSQAARTALATRRPVFVNDVTWFDDLPFCMDGLTKCVHPGGLEYSLMQELARPYITDCSWDKVAAITLRDYERALRDKQAHEHPLA
jgi:hypothetical protein